MEGGAKVDIRKFKKMLSVQINPKNQLQSFKFQIKLFVYKKICCSNRLAKKLFYKDISFGYNEGLYNGQLEKITQMLSMTKVMQENLRIEKLNAFNEAKEMLSSVKKYYSSKISMIKQRSITNQDFKSMNFVSDDE